MRAPGAVLFADELRSRARGGLDVSYAFTRQVPEGWARAPGRVDGASLAASARSPEQEPTCYVCGPTGFVETVADLLVAGGHQADHVRTERFGPSGRHP